MNGNVSFVSTNSITQGEQAGILWTELFSRYHVKIHFGHRTFAWESEARGKAHVHVVIIGLAAFDTGNKRIYDYESGSEHASVDAVKNISPYLVEGPDRAVSNRTKPLCDVPRMLWGNKPTDGGHLILSPEECEELISAEPDAEAYIRPFMSGGDFLNNIKRYCLWLAGADPAKLRDLPRVMERVEAVRKCRSESKAPSTQAYAKFPTLFRQIAQPDSDYLAIPEVSSERRAYIPIAFVERRVICSNKIQFIPNATVYHFGVLSSATHMAWVRQVCGRLKSDYSYSNSLVYNNYPWPQSPMAKQKEAVKAAAQKVLDMRAQFLAPVGQTSGLPVKGASGSQSQNARARTGSAPTPPEEALTGRPEVRPTKTASLADLYDPLSMPPALVKAHAELDRAVDLCYRPQPFASERQRVEYLFGLYEQLTAPLLPAARPKRPRKRLSA